MAISSVHFRFTALHSTRSGTRVRCGIRVAWLSQRSLEITTSAKTPDPDQLRRINEVVDRLVKEHGYCPVCANELLTYVGTLLSR